MAGPTTERYRRSFPDRTRRVEGAELWNISCPTGVRDGTIDVLLPGGGVGRASQVHTITFVPEGTGIYPFLCALHAELGQVGVVAVGMPLPEQTG